MIVGIMSLQLFIPGAHSLKDRRQAVLSLKDRLRTRFNVSVAEVGDHENWQLAVLGVCAVSSDRDYVEGLLNQVERFARSDRRVELMRCEKEFV
jgi:uncharacterized protein YlxP (DUF503 family)